MTLPSPTPTATHPGSSGGFEIVVALDGSEDAELGLRLVAGTSWPQKTWVHVLRVLEDVPVGSIPPELVPLDRDRLRLVLAGVSEIDGIDFEIRVGHPATGIVRFAAAHEAGLVVVGNRGQGAIASALLGSVSAEVADRAPCPVLLARGDRTRRLLVADDGSHPAGSAVDLIVEHRLFRGAECRVFGVAQAPPAELDAEIASLQQVTADTVGRLVAVGITASAEVVVGSPAARITELAAEWADLVVVGSHGRTGLRRLALGSVSRSVLIDAPCSVLVVRASGADPGRTE